MTTGASPSEFRIFFGGLSPSLKANALRSLLEPFGHVTCIDLHPRGFAHLSLKGEEDVIEKCLTTLHGTTWYGSALRVERARDHFSLRLQREWDACSDNVQTALVPMTDLDNANLGSKIDSPVLARFSWRGKHVQFPEDDDDDVENPGIGSPVHGRNAPQEAQDIQKVDLPQAKDKTLRKTQKRSSAVESTLSLFGLQGLGTIREATEEECSKMNMSVTQSDKDVLKRRKCKEEISAGKATHIEKRERHSDELIGMNIAKARAIEEDTTLIDLDEEKIAALAVLRRMFKSDDPTSDDLRSDSTFPPHLQTADKQIENTLQNSHCRRSALFRKLIQSPRALEKRASGPGVVILKSSIDRRKGLFRSLNNNKPVS